MVRRNAEPARKDVRELRTIAVLAADDLLFALRVVARGEESAEDQFGNVALFRRMFLDRDSVTVVFHCYNQRLGRSALDRHIDSLNGLAALGDRRTDKGVPSIYKDLIEKLVETWVKLDSFPDHFVGFGIENPSLFAARRSRPNVGIRQLQDVLFVAQDLVGFKLIGHGSFLVLENGPLGNQIYVA